MYCVDVSCNLVDLCSPDSCRENFGDPMADQRFRPAWFRTFRGKHVFLRSGIDSGIRCEDE